MAAARPCKLNWLLKIVQVLAVQFACRAVASCRAVAPSHQSKLPNSQHDPAPMITVEL
jgi:hypothetical protein